MRLKVQQPSPPVYIKVGNSRTDLWMGKKKFSSATGKSESSKLFKKIKSGEIFLISVVPEVSLLLARLAKAQGFHLRIVNLSDIPIEPAYPKTLGVDRLMNGLGGLEFTKKNFIVIDIGTALTVDFFSKDRRHLGGWITAGPHLISKALHQFTAKLPRVEPKTTSARLGRSTLESLLVGQRAFLHGMILEVRILGKQIFGGGFEIIVTGGGASLLPKGPEKRISDLSLWGLKSLIEKYSYGKTSTSRSQYRSPKNIRPRKS